MTKVIDSLLMLVVATFGSQFCFAINQYSKNLTVTEGDDIAFRCFLTSENKFLRRSWTKGSTIIFANSKNWLENKRWVLLSDKNNEYVAQLRDVQTEDEGLYTCTAYDSMDKSQQVLSSIYLTVHTSPAFTDVSEDLTVEEGSNVDLKCEASGKPAPKIKWRLIRPSTDGIHATSNSLPLNAVHRGSGGKYECVADNGVLLPIMHTIQLTVKYPPELDTYGSHSLENKGVGSSTSMECAATSVPLSTFTWIHPSGKKILSSSDNVVNIVQDSRVQSKLLLRSITDSDFGNYTCVAENDMGTARYTLVLAKEPASAEYIRPSPKKLFELLNGINQGEGPGGNANSLNAYSQLRIFTCLVALCFHAVFLLAVF